MYTRLPRYFSRGYRSPSGLLRRFKWGRQRVRNRVSDYDLYSLHTTLLEILAFGLDHMSKTAHGWPDQLYDTYEDWVQDLRWFSGEARWLLEWEHTMVRDPEYPDIKYHTVELDNGTYQWVSDNTPEENSKRAELEETYKKIVKTSERDLYRFLRKTYYHLWD